MSKGAIKNIGNISSCFGCTVCGGVCPVDIIRIGEQDGFLKPYISNQEACIECGICLKTCSYFNKDTLDFPNLKGIDFFSGIVENKRLLYSTTSGGIVYKILEFCLKQGIKSVGVRYNYESNRPEHYITDSLLDLNETKGSKYLQSNLSQVIYAFSKNSNYVVVGTPCQIASLHNLLLLKHLRNNFILIDFFCHGVPDARFWDIYRRYFQKIIGKIKSVNFRPKDFGWHNSIRVKLVGKKSTHITKPPKEDMFFSFFLGDRCLQKECYDGCVFKQTHSCADIRVGDLWGGEFSGNETGVSGILVLSDVGRNLLKNLKNIRIIQVDPDVILSGQMKKNARRAPSFLLAKIGILNKWNLKCLYIFCSIIDFMYHLPHRLSRKFRRLLKL